MDERLREYVGIVRTVRHDVNGPLTAALGNVQLLLEDPACEDAEVRETLKDIETDLRRIGAMIRRLSDINADVDDGA